MMFGCYMGALEACRDDEALLPDIYAPQASTLFNGMRMSSESAQSVDNKDANK